MGCHRKSLVFDLLLDFDPDEDLGAEYDDDGADDGGARAHGRSGFSLISQKWEGVLMK